MNQIDTGATGVGGYVVNKSLPGILINWKDKLQGFLSKTYER